MEWIKSQNQRPLMKNKINILKKETYKLKINDCHGKTQRQRHWNHTSLSFLLFWDTSVGPTSTYTHNSQLHFATFKQENQYLRLKVQNVACFHQRGDKLLGINGTLMEASPTKYFSTPKTPHLRNPNLKTLLAKKKKNKKNLRKTPT